MKESMPMRGAVALIGLLYSLIVQSYELPDNLQIHGFASQAYIVTTDNNFFGNTEDDGDLDFTELGLNASLRPLPNLQLSAQILSRRAGAGDDGDIRLDYGMADYSFIASGTDRWGLRIGRIINPLGLYNDTRDVAFTRPSIFLPQSIYFDRTRNLALSSDALHIYGEHRTGNDEIFFQLGSGKPRADNSETENALFGRSRIGELDNELSYLGRVLWERDGGRIRLALSAARVNIGYDPRGDPLGHGSIRFEPWILSAQYNAERWSLTGEYALRHFAYNNFRVSDISFTGESYYLQGTYRIAHDWEVMMRYDVLFTDRNDRNGNKFQAQTGGPDHSRFAKDWTVGVRWDMTPSFMLRAEYHHVDGTAWLPPEDNPNIFDTKQNWNLFAILVSFRF